MTPNRICNHNLSQQSRMILIHVRITHHNNLTAYSFRKFENENSPEYIILILWFISLSAVYEHLINTKFENCKIKKTIFSTFVPLKIQPISHIKYSISNRNTMIEADGVWNRINHSWRERRWSHVVAINFFNNKQSVN